MQKISIHEWRWAALVICSILLISGLPQIVGFGLSTADNQYPGVSFNPLDAHTYLAKIEQGRAGDWLFRLAHTGEKDTNGAFIYTFYLILGKIGNLPGISNLVVFHSFRLICAAGLLIILYRFVSLFLTEVRHRRFAFLIASIASGLGWLALPLRLTTYIPESLAAETFTFFQILAAPHFSLTVACLLLTIQYSLFGLENRGRLNYLWAAIACCVATLNHSFLLIPLAAILGSYWLRLCLGQRRFLLSEMPGLVAVGVAGLPGVLFTWLATINNPLFAIFIKQNVVQTDGVLEALVTFGLLTPLAALGIWWIEFKMTRQETDPTQLNRWRLLSTWVLISVPLIFAPLAFNKRLSEGIAVALACLSVLAWEQLVTPLLTKPEIQNTLRIGLISFLSLSTLTILGVNVALTISERENQYYGLGEQGAFEWLRQNAQPDAIVLSDSWFSNVLPAQTNLKVRPFYGHPIETLNVKVKEAALKEFFNSTTGPDRRAKIIRENNLSYLVYYAPRAKLLGDFDPTKAEWPLLFERNNLKIYQLG